MQKCDIRKLNELYNESEECDRDLFAEQRSNVLLNAGYHYRQAAKNILGRFKDVQAPQDQKLRLTKNHVAKVMRHYKNTLVSYAPWVRVLPSVENDPQSQKTAEMHDAVVQQAKDRYHLTKKIARWADDFTVIGEVATKVYFDPNKGEIIGYEQAKDEEGNPLFVGMDGEPTPFPIDPLTGVQFEPMKGEKPIFKGDFVFEPIHGFNLLRAKRAETMDDSPYIAIRKMMDVSEAKALAGDDEEKLAMIQESVKTTFKVFDGTRGEYVDAKNQVMLREFYFRPCVEYPNGYFYIATETGILFDGELPFGLFPIVYEGWNEIQTTPRCRSHIKNIRPNQAEINRAASSIATTQVTLGDDKVIYQTGAKMTKGAEFPGVRSYSVSGQPPIVIPGRSGEQYFAYLQSQVDEIYQLSDMNENLGENVSDPWMLLYASLRQKKKFTIYCEKFERFVCEVLMLYCKLAQHYLADDEIIRATGRREMINIPEFKQSSHLDCVIKVAPVGEDLETLMGKSLQFNHILQYVGSDLPKDAIGKILRNLPFMNNEEAFSDFTLDYDNIKSDMLALDRGQEVPADPDDNHDLYVKYLTNRIKKKDFDFMPPQVKQLFYRKRQQHQMLKAEQMKKLKALEADFIPSGGARVKCDFYLPDPQNPNKTSRASLPQEALMWLVERLADQGSLREGISLAAEGAQAGYADIMGSGQGSPPQPQMNQQQMGAMPVPAMP